MKTHHFLLFLIFLCWRDANAQTPFFKHYTTEHGLPSMETYQVRQDSKGYIWIATDRGVCKFNGTEFKLFNQQDGLENITVFCLKEDDRGRMWAATFSGDVFYYENDKFNAFEYNDTISKITNEATIEDMIILKDTIWLSIDNKIVKIDPSGKTLISTIPRKNGKIEYHEIATRQYLFSSFPREKGLHFSLLEKAGIKEVNIPEFICTNKATKCTVKKLVNDDIIIAFCHMILIIRGDSSIIKIPVDGVAMNSSIIEDEKGIVWLGLENGGVIKLDPTKNYEIIDRLLRNYSITFIEKDNEGGLWFSTIEQGVIYMPSPTIINFELEGKLAKKKYTNLEICNNELYISSYYGLYKLNESTSKTWTAKKVLPEKIDDKITEMMCFQHSLILNLGGYSYLLRNNDLQYLNLTYGCMIADSNFFYSLFYNISKVSSTGKIIEKGTQLKRGAYLVRSALMDDEKRIWLGRRSGLDIYQNDTIHSMCEKFPAFCNRITDIKKGKYIYVSTLGAGVIRIDPKTNEQYQLTIENGLPDNNVSAIYPDTLGNLWVAASSGLCFFKINENQTYTLKKKYTALDGIVKGEVIDILPFKGYIWVLAQDGLSAIPQKHYETNSTPPAVKMSSVTLLNEESLFLDNKIQLDHTQNDIKLTYEGISFKNAFKKSYAYRLLGLDSNYSYTLDNHVQYISLQPGDYTFEVKALNSDNLMSKKAAKFSFTIVPPLWRKVWFQSVATIAILLGIIFSVKARERSKNRKIKMELSVLENEQKAVTAQINPHFIYNAMNSIQYYILENDSEKAVDYLARSSSLMRKVLTNTKNSFILLSSELNILELYLQLEKERFEEKFNYQLQIDNNLKTESILIPSMIIQPHVENAIWHGLLKKDQGKGELNIKLSATDSELVWSIQDNGIGREASKNKKEHREQGYTSSGIELTQKRLDLLSKQQGNKYSIEIIDLKDNKGKTSGTQVIITMYKKQLPYELYNSR